MYSQTALEVICIALGALSAFAAILGISVGNK